MNRPKRPSSIPPRRRPTGPTGPTLGGGPPRRRSPLDNLPQNVEPRFKVLGLVERQIVLASAEPMELVVVQGFTREIEDIFGGFKGRPDDFWTKYPKLLETARKLDDIFHRIQQRKSGG